LTVKKRTDGGKPSPEETSKGDFLPISRRKKQGKAKGENRERVP